MKALLSLVVIIGMTAVVATVLVGTSTFEGTVVSEPYASGLQWDAQQRARAESGWKVTRSPGPFRQGHNDFSVSVADRDGRPVRDADIILTVSYPSTDRYDRVVRLDRQPDGRYAGSIDLPRSGWWNVLVVITQGGRQARFDDVVHADK
jgi:nitrogen fixation protein FixH